jgi:HEAT repeat protein
VHPDVLPVRSTRLERRDAAAGLEPVVAAIAKSDGATAWLAWTVPAVARAHHGSSPRERDWQRNSDGCVLDDEGRFENGSSTTDDTTALVVLARLTGGIIDRVTFADARCTVQAGTRTVYWIAGVRPGDSVATLAEIVRRDGKSPGRRGDAGRRPERARSGALAVIALTDDPSSDRVLEEFVAPEVSPTVRRDAAFWLGAARGATGAEVIDRLSRTDGDDDFREHLTFVLTLTGDAGIDRLVDLARHDASSRVRGQALFWVAQKAGERAVGTLAAALDDDPDVEVRKRAVFAISQLPKDEGVPKLIALAGTHRDREVRKQAMFWLGQTGDPRALTFFEQVLGR